MSIKWISRESSDGLKTRHTGSGVLAEYNILETDWENSLSVKIGDGTQPLGSYSNVAGAKDAAEFIEQLTRSIE